jgi:hypothetical protein
MITTEQFYANYEFSDEKVNDNMELTDFRIIEMLDSFYKFKIKEVTKRIKFLEKDYELSYELQLKLDMFDKNDAADFDELAESLRDTKTKIQTLKWVLTN